MATTPARGTPEQNPTAAVVESPVAASDAAPRSLIPTAEAAATERASKANSPADVRALLSDLRKAKAPAVAVTPAPETPAAPATEEVTPGTEAATPAGEETPATEETAAPETPAEGAETEEEDDGDGPISPITGKRTHLRFKEDDKVGRLAASIMKRNRDLGMEEAVERAKNQLGIKPKPAEAATESAAPKSDLPDSVEAVDKELERIEAEREKALIDLRFEDVAKFDKSMRQLDRHRFTLERDGERNLAKQESDYNAAYSASETKATDLYEFAGNPDSDGYKRMAEIDAALKENNDPLYASPDKPLRVAQMVAAELKIAPKRKGAPVAPAKVAAPVVTPAPKKQILPGGGSRTTPPVSNPTTAVAADVAKISNVHELRNFLKPLVKRR